MNRNIRIAIIDSGIDIHHNDNVVLTKSFVDEDIKDRCGHGTMCMNIITSCVEAVDYLIIKILDENGYSCSSLLLEALNYLLEIDVDIINMSISIFSDNEQSILNKIENTCKLLYNQKKIMVCSLSNKSNINTYPAAFNTVIGVKGTTLNSHEIYWFNKSKIVQAIADSEPRLIKSSNNRRLFFKGNSKATAVMTAIIANKILRMNFNYTTHELLNILYLEAIKNEWSDYALKRMEHKYFQKNIKLNKDFNLEYCVEINHILKNFFGSDNILYKNFVENRSSYINIKNMDLYVGLIDIIGTELKLFINYDNIRCYDFYNIFTLSDAVKERWSITHQYSQ